LSVAAVATSTWYGGLGPGLLTDGLAMVLSHDIVLTPQFALASGSPGQDSRLVLCACDAILITWLMVAIVGK
jgi:hypothetical protein